MSERVCTNGNGKVGKLARKILTPKQIEELKKHNKEIKKMKE